MSCCGGNCGCGSACKCGTGCGGCKMYSELSYSETTKGSAQSLVIGVAPQKKENGECAVGGEDLEGCHCGPNCQCDPCTCN